MKTLDAMSAIDQGFDTCAFNMSLNWFKRSSLLTLSLNCWFESNLPHHLKNRSTWGSGVTVTHNLAKVAQIETLCVRKLMITAKKFKTLQRYGLRFINLLLKHPIYGAWHPSFCGGK